MANLHGSARSESSPTILRLLRARVRAGAEQDLLERVRTLVSRIEPDSEPVDFTVGLKHDAGATHFLAMSIWPGLSTLMVATGGEVSRPARWAKLEDVCEAVEVGTYERLPPAPGNGSLSHGRLLGVVTGRAKPDSEAVAQSMIDRSVGAALEAGALAAHLGRRLSGAATEVAVVVEWPDRETLARFVRARDVGAIDPRFAELMGVWRFETYDALGPERLLIPPSGPAVLVTDDEGRYVDATPGIERVLGIPGELLYGRAVSDVVVDTDAGAELWSRFREDGEQEGLIDLRMPTGELVRVRYRAATNVPAPGLHASVLSLPDEPPDPRSVHLIVSDALQPRERPSLPNGGRDALSLGAS